jgi:ubiquinone/menaquinone biosynthesis C-methylase UbiE
MPHDPLDQLLTEQIAYYRARAGEYDQTSPVDPASRAALVAAIDAFAPTGNVLELACGTGEWTVELARHATQLTAVDSSPEVLARNAERVNRRDVRYLQADLFAWSPPERFDVVFFSAWLSHVPPQRFAAFWELVGRCLGDDGRVFVIDELPAAAAHEQPIEDAPAPAVTRRLLNGAEFRAVKVFYAPEELQLMLAELGWRTTIETAGSRFFWAVAQTV